MDSDTLSPAVGRRSVLALLLALGLGAAVPPAPAAAQDVLPPWSPGELDIYHLNTGGGNATVFILPDGTTLLLDAGDFDRAGFEARSTPLRLTPRRPSDDITPGAAVAGFIARVMPAGQAPRIDYAVISHFHDDHYGAVRAGLARDASDAYWLTGITEVGDRVPIGTLIDRAYPDYATRLDVGQRDDLTFINYRTFQAAAQARGTRLERLRAGDTDQIVLRHAAARFPTFRVLNVKSSEELAEGEGVRALFGPLETRGATGALNENVQSLALKISYGPFDYFTGGDNTGLAGPGVPAWMDVETPLAAAVGPVDVTALNHHGNRDAVGAAFLAGLRPRVLVQQVWVSDQPGGEVVHRLASRALWPGPRDVFATALADETRAAIGGVIDRTYTAVGGTVLVRVAPGGGDYRVFMLEDGDFSLGIRSSHGPYPSR